MNETITNEQKKLKADSIVKTNVLWALGAGLIPFPIADVFALSTVQVKMLAELADTFGVSYSKEGGKSLIAALLSSSGATALSLGTASTVKSIPVVGQTVGAVTSSVCGGAMTYAVGHVFIKHFEGGGTLLNFDPVKVKDSLVEKYEKGLDKVKNWRSKPEKSTPDEQPSEQPASA